MQRLPFWRRWLPRSSSPKNPVAEAIRELRPHLASRVRHFAEAVVGPVAPESDPDIIDLAHDYPHLDIPPAKPSPTGDSLAELQGAVADGMLRRHGVAFDPETQVRILPGGIAPLARFLDLFLGVGDAAVVFEPDVASFASSVRARGGIVHGVPAKLDGGCVRFDVEALIRAGREAKVLLLSHPNAPSGAAFAAEDVEQLLFWAAKFDLRIYLDDTFGDLHAGSNPAKLVGLPRAAGRVVVGGCFGLALGRPDFDCGWLAGAANVVLLAGSAQEVAGGNVSPILVRATLAAMKGSPQAVVYLCEVIDERREYVRERLRMCGLDPVVGASGVFVLARLPKPLDGPTVAGFLRVRKVRLAEYGHSIRINIGGDERQLREGLTRMLEGFHELLHADSVGRVEVPAEGEFPPEGECPEGVASAGSESIE